MSDSHNLMCVRSARALAERAARELGDLLRPLRFFFAIADGRASTAREKAELCPTLTPLVTDTHPAAPLRAPRQGLLQPLALVADQRFLHLLANPGNREIVTPALPLGLLEDEETRVKRGVRVGV